jgi:hypothetical protein
MQTPPLFRLAIAAIAIAAGAAQAQTTTPTTTTATTTTSALPPEVTTAQNQVISDLQALKAALTQYEADKAANAPTAADLSALQAVRQTLQKKPGCAGSGRQDLFERGSPSG